MELFFFGTFKSHNWKIDVVGFSLIYTVYGIQYIQFMQYIVQYTAQLVYTIIYNEFHTIHKYKYDIVYKANFIESVQ